jgi:hypothetical protein
MLRRASDGLTLVGVMHWRMQQRGPYCEVRRKLWDAMIALLWSFVVTEI